MNVMIELNLSTKLELEAAISILITQIIRLFEEINQKIDEIEELNQWHQTHVR